MQGFEFRFPAVRGIQAGREFYVAMCPLGAVPKLFVPDESSLAAEHRGQRVLNKTRVPQLAQFIANHSGDYAFSAITACIRGQSEFYALGTDTDWELGRLAIAVSTDLLITDGQHRWRAICDALNLEPELANETIPVVLYVDEGLERRQQMFADLNMHAVRPTRSLGVLYDHRDPIAELTRALAEEVELFAGRTEVEKTTISNRSNNLFTLSAIYQASALLLGKKAQDEVDDEEARLAQRFWTVLSEILPGWRDVISGDIKPWELRAEHIHAHGVVLQAMGAAGRSLIEQDGNWEGRLRSSSLATIDWSRSNTALWEGRALSNGRISKARKSVLLTTALLKERLGLPLSQNELRAEKDLEEIKTRMRNDVA